MVEAGGYLARPGTGRGVYPIARLAALVAAIALIAIGLVMLIAPGQVAPRMPWGISGDYSLAMLGSALAGIGFYLLITGARRRWRAIRPALISGLVFTWLFVVILADRLRVEGVGSGGRSLRTEIALAVTVIVFLLFVIALWAELATPGSAGFRPEHFTDLFRMTLTAASVIALLAALAVYVYPSVIVDNAGWLADAPSVRLTAACVASGAVALLDIALVDDVSCLVPLVPTSFAYVVLAAFTTIRFHSQIDWTLTSVLLMAVIALVAVLGVCSLSTTVSVRTVRH